MILGQEVQLKWRHLIQLGCRVSFHREVYNARHNIAMTWAHVEHPTGKFQPLCFRPTEGVHDWMTSRVDDTPHALPFLVDIGAKFTSNPQGR